MTVRPDPDTGRLSGGSGIIAARTQHRPRRASYDREPATAHELRLLLPTMEGAPALYRQRDPKASPLYQLVVEHYEELKQIYRGRFEDAYGRWQGHWENAVARFLKCGDLFYGFARVYCSTCRHTFVVPFSCRSRGLCPSCEAKRRALWAEHIIENVLPPTIPYRMLVFTIPRCLRRTFMRERKLLGDFARIAYESTQRFFAEQFPTLDGKPYFVCALQTFGDFANPHPHLHSLCSVGIKDTDGTFHAAPEDLDFAPLEEMFRHAMLNMLREKKRITEQTHKRLLSWRHSGFSANASVMVAPGDTAQLERIACYVLKPPISLARLTYKPGSDVAVYRGKYNPSTKSNFQAIDVKEFLVRLLCHVPAPHECLIRYFGAAASTERRGQVIQDEPLLAEENEFVKKRRSSWARMIEKIYGVDPLTCPKCGSLMRIIAFIHDPAVIEKILRHIGRWDPPRGPPASTGDPAGGRVVAYDEFSDIPDHDERDDDFYHGEELE